MEYLAAFLSERKKPTEHLLVSLLSIQLYLTIKNIVFSSVKNDLAWSSVLETHGVSPTSRLAGGGHSSRLYSTYNGTGGRNRTFCFRVSDENINRYTTPAYLGIKLSNLLHVRKSPYRRPTCLASQPYSHTHSLPVSIQYSFSFSSIGARPSRTVPQLVYTAATSHCLE